MKIYFDYECETFSDNKTSGTVEFETDLDLEYIEEKYFDLRMYGMTTQVALESIGLY